MFGTIRDISEQRKILAHLTSSVSGLREFCLPWQANARRCVTLVEAFVLSKTVALLQARLGVSAHSREFSSSHGILGDGIPN